MTRHNADVESTSTEQIRAHLGPEVSAQIETGPHKPMSPEQIEAVANLLWPHMHLTVRRRGDVSPS